MHWNVTGRIILSADLFDYKFEKGSMKLSNVSLSKI